MKTNKHKPTKGEIWGEQIRQRYQKFPMMVSILRTELNGIKRVLKLVDGYISTQPRDLLLGWDGGIMTWDEIREHIKAAINVIPKL
jgi:hypothetical protein